MGELQQSGRPLSRRAQRAEKRASPQGRGNYSRGRQVSRRRLCGNPSRNTGTAGLCPRSRLCSGGPPDHLLIFCAKVDEPTCATPRRRDITPPSVASIEELRTLPFEELLREFWEGKSAIRLANGDVKHLPGVYDNSQGQAAMRDSRLPLTALN